MLSDRILTDKDGLRPYYSILILVCVSLVRRIENDIKIDSSVEITANGICGGRAPLPIGQQLH